MTQLASKLIEIDLIQVVPSVKKQKILKSLLGSGSQTGNLFREHDVVYVIT